MAAGCMPVRRCLLVFGTIFPEFRGTVRFGLTDSDVVVEQEADDRIESPQRVSVPCCINGWFRTEGDLDWYEFPAKKGQTFQIEAWGERYGRLMDLDVAIHDASGKLLTTLKEVLSAKGAAQQAVLGFNGSTRRLDCPGGW